MHPGLLQGLFTLNYGLCLCLAAYQKTTLKTRCIVPAYQEGEESGEAKTTSQHLRNKTVAADICP